MYMSIGEYPLATHDYMPYTNGYSPKILLRVLTWMSMSELTHYSYIILISITG